ANPQGFVHGGSVTKLADTAAGVCAARHARCRVATVLIKEMTFTAPVKIGALVTINAKLVGVGRTSMQIDVEVWAEEVTSGERVLELACGSGRVLRALAAAGHICTGVDASPAMLDLARRHSAAQDVHIHLVQARMEALPPDLGPFDLALCVLNSFAYLPTQAD